MSGRAGLNFVCARGKWYVYTRDRSKCLLRGFVGSRADVDQYVEANLGKLHADAAESEAQRLRRAALRRAKFRKLAAERLHRITLKRCRQKSIPFELTAEQVETMLLKAGDQCEVSRLPFDYGETDTKREWHRNPLMPSLDRIQRDQGYRPSNLRVVSTSVNIAINEWGLAHFLRICRAVSQRGLENVLQTDGF